jgi:hypothetical protein
MAYKMIPLQVGDIQLFSTKLFFQYRLSFIFQIKLNTGDFYWIFDMES